MIRGRRDGVMKTVIIYFLDYLLHQSYESDDRSWSFDSIFGDCESDTMGRESFSESIIKWEKSGTG